MSKTFHAEGEWDTFATLRDFCCKNSKPGVSSIGCLFLTHGNSVDSRRIFTNPSISANWCWLANEHMITSLATACLRHPPSFFHLILVHLEYHSYWHVLVEQQISLSVSCCTAFWISVFIHVGFLDYDLWFLIFIVVLCILIMSEFFLPTNAPFIKHTKC